MDYAEFLRLKGQSGDGDGFAPIWLPDLLFPFQRAMTEWGIRQGRAALFEDCGLGKTIQELVWAENVVRHTNKPVLLLTPLAVGGQTVAEAERFGIEARISRDGKAHRCVTVTNYERLERFDPADFAGAVCDESSAIKNFNGVHRAQVTAFMRHMRYRLLATATAAPNDYTELGTSSEALGYLGHIDMLQRFFKNDQNTVDTKRRLWATHGGGDKAKWRFKGHARQQFWKWVCSWARAIRKPSDLGFSDEGFTLPELVEVEHLVRAKTLAPGMLFETPPQGLAEEREESRRTMQERCEKVVELVNHPDPSVSWCHLNAEGDLLARMIPGAVQVSGSDSPEEKEEKFAAFASGQIVKLVIKPKIGAWGLNWQHCAHTTMFPSHSFEAKYQAVRRFWRFGQKRPVVVDTVTTEGGQGILENQQRKSRSADAMFEELVANMNDVLRLARSTDHESVPEVPSWLSSTNT